MLAVIGLGIVVYWMMIVTSSSGEPLPPIDHIRVEKSKGVLSVYRDNKLLKQYKIALGFSPRGHKASAGDGKTPEGLYYVSAKNSQSRFHLALKVSYPNQKDKANAKARGVSAGGDIMIHGLPKHFAWVGVFHTFWNWTQGCIAVTNEDIEEIFAATPVGTPIEIIP